MKINKNTTTNNKLIKTKYFSIFLIIRNDTTDKIIKSETIMIEYSVLGICKCIWKWHFSYF